ncbi:MAG: sugar ABC transporter ATP-binding protein [Lachnospiraceae bacterium]|nr:sugar ABC transporter ATP-binding protein [Lachnospiraceae bacterium]
METNVLELINISKSFSKVKVLHDINLSVKKGEVHALVGENGAGKSTLMKILSGFYPHDQFFGEINVDGRPVKFSTVKDAEKAGIELITQELELVPQLKVYENVFLGNEIKRHGIINENAMIRKTKELLDKMGLETNPQDVLEYLGVGQQQMVAIAKALARESRILIFDEPTAALSDSEADKLFDIIKELKQQNITIIYISHRLKEVLAISDRITVLRDGKVVHNDLTSRFSEEKIIRYMIGRELVDQYPERKAEPGETVLELKNFSAVSKSGKPIVENISFHVRSGEIVGISGLVGAGRTELVKAVFGALPAQKSGKILIHGKETEINNPMDAINCGIGFVSEDRKIEGLVNGADILSNIIMTSYKSVSRRGIINDSISKQMTNRYMEQMKVKASGIYQIVDGLSGGNQQKVCIAKALMSKPQILILDEPTRGIDVGAKREIYLILNQLVKEGVAVLIVSSELPEILGMSDRILVMKDGKITKELDRKEASQETIMRYATLEEKVL